MSNLLFEISLNLPRVVLVSILLFIPISLLPLLLPQVVGLVANSYSLLHLLRERLVHKNQNRMILLLIHLTVADLCVILIGIPLEIAWTATVSWWADEIMCKVKLRLRGQAGHTDHLAGHTVHTGHVGHIVQAGHTGNTGLFSKIY